MFVNHYLGFDGWANSVDEVSVEITPEGGSATATTIVKLADGRTLRETAQQDLAPSSAPEDIKFGQKAAASNSLRRCLGRIVVVRASGETDVILLPDLEEGAEGRGAGEAPL